MAVEGGKVKNYSGTYSFGVENENNFIQNYREMQPGFNHRLSESWPKI